MTYPYFDRKLMNAYQLIGRDPMRDDSVAVLDICHHCATRGQFDFDVPCPSCGGRLDPNGELD